jgi:hypothetical protein
MICPDCMSPLERIETGLICRMCGYQFPDKPPTIATDGSIPSVDPMLEKVCKMVQREPGTTVQDIMHSWHLGYIRAARLLKEATND